MSDEIKRKTVCLKLAKNGIYLCKNPNNAKTSTPGKISLADRSKYCGPSSLEKSGSSAGASMTIKESQEETVLQKFIRGFDCGEYCDDVSSCESTQHPSTGLSEIAAVTYGNPVMKARKRSKKEGESSGSNSRCRVEFVSPAGISDLTSEYRPLVVDLSRKENVLSEPAVVSQDELRLLNRNFITPKVKVENFSLTDVTSLPLIIRAPETPVSSSSPQSPYPSTKIEIDFTGSSMQSEGYIDLGTSSQPDCNANNYILLQDMNSNKNFVNNINGKTENHQYEESRRYSQQSNISKDGRQSIINHGPSSVPFQTYSWEVIEAARQLYWKRTRTLLQWVRPQSASGSQVKTAIEAAWTKLPDWQKQIYIDQVTGKSSSDVASPIVNPQVMEMVENDSWLRDQTNDWMSQRANPAPQQPPKKRKYTKRSTSQQQITPTNAVFNFFSSL